MANTAEHKAAERSLSEYLDIAIPLPHIAQQCLEWRLEGSAEAKENLIEKLVGGLYCNDHKSYRKKVREALEGFNITEKG